MTDEYITIKVDVGLLMKKIEEWKIKNSINISTFNVDNDIVFNASLNKNKNNDSQPLYVGKNIAVWHNVAKPED